MSDSKPPGDREGRADETDGIVDETSKDEQRFNEQLMEALSDQPPPSEPPPSADSGAGAGPDSDAPTESVEEITLSSPDVIAAESDALEGFYGGTDTFDAGEEDAPDSISLETISATALESLEEVADGGKDDSWERWSSRPPADSEPPSLRSLAGHLPAPAPVPGNAPPADDELFDAIGPDPYNSLSESLRPPPVMKSAPQLIVDDEVEDEGEAEAVPLKRKRPAAHAPAKATPRKRKESGEWVKQRSPGRRKRDHRSLVWPCVAFFCLGVVTTLVVQRLLPTDGQPVATGPDRPAGPTAQAPAGTEAASPSQQPTSHEVLAGPDVPVEEAKAAPDAAAPLPSGWMPPDPYAGEPVGDLADGGAEPAASAPDGPSSAEAAPPPGEAPPFDTAAAAAALGAAAGAAAGCADGEHKGSARVAVTFAPSGRATVAVVESGSLLGTPVASCVANMMRNAKVPAFSGGPVTVRKKVRIR